MEGDVFNAHLIAAAPDLLAACKYIIEVIDLLTEGQPHAIVIGKKTQDKLRQAIAKAEGRQ